MEQNQDRKQNPDTVDVGAERISVALCTCNGEPYLREQLDSLSSQTRLPDELIVCDDLSSDGTMEILRQFALESSFVVRIVQNETRLGFRKNFEQAAKLCSGSLIFFCDQDDIWEAQKLELFENAFRNNSEVGMVLCEAQLVDADNNTLNLLLTKRNNISGYRIKEEIERDCARFCLKNYIFWSGMALAFRRSYLPLLVPFSDTVFHDLWCARILSAVTEIRFLEQPLVRYRIHGQNASGSNIQDVTILSAIQQARNPGVAQYYAEVASAMRELVQRLECFPERIKVPETISRFRNKGKHYQVRFDIQTGRAGKWGIVFELLNGNYFRYSRGLKSAVADLIS